jgi:hypothetical protein
MSTLIHFTSGKTQEIETGRFDKFVVELKQRGIRLMIDANDERRVIIPLNSNTIEFVEERIEKAEVVEEPEVEEELDEIAELKQIKKEAKAAQDEVESKKDIEEKREEAMQELMAKSSCTHTDTTLFRHDTAKGSRYFPVCTFCGKRERYVKADSLTDDQRENAQLWKD